MRRLHFAALLAGLALFAGLTASALSPDPYAHVRRIQDPHERARAMTGLLYDEESGLYSRDGGETWYGKRERNTLPYEPPAYAENFWDAPEGEVCAHCGGSMVLEEHLTTTRFAEDGWLTTDFTLCPKNAMYTDRVQARYTEQYILCEECRFCTAHQSVRETRTDCEH